MNPEDAMPEMSQDDAPVEITLDKPGEEVEVTEVAIAEPPPPPAPVLPSVPSSGLAVASLVSGVAGLTLLPIVGGVLAIVLGYMARREIRQRPDEVSGDGLALAGIVMGWISVGLVVVACLFFGGLAACGVLGSLGSGGY
jgi:hypothetical protein